MADRSSLRLVAVGASAGGVEALSRFVAHLPGDLPAAVLVVLHVLPDGHSVLPTILDRAGPLPATTAEDGKTLSAGQVIVALPDCHLVVEDGVACNVRGARENGHRPAVDPLLRSVAAEAGRDAIAVVLSGTRDDGAAGAAAVKAAGGLVFVQAPTDALYSSMPASVLRAVEVDGQGSAAEVAALVVAALTRSPSPREVGPGVDPSRRVDAAAPGHDVEDTRASGLTCPDCGGAIWVDGEAGATSFNCHTGHRFSDQSMVAGQRSATEAALWVAIRHLEERAGLMRRMATSIGERGPVGAQRFAAAAAESEQHATIIRELVAGGEAMP